MRVLIVNPPAPIDYGYIDFPFFSNLGSLQQAAVLENYGYDVSVADSFSLRESDVYPGETGNSRLAGCRIETLLSSYQGACFDAVVLCMSVFHKPYTYSATVYGAIQATREMFPNARLIAADVYFGGMHYIGYDKESFFRNYPQVDYLIQGEAEVALVEFLKNMSERDDLPGSTTGNCVTLLDDLPYPAWHLIDVEKYWGFISRFLRTTRRVEPFSPDCRIIPMITSRGCLFHCSFCCQSVNGQKIRRRAYSNRYILDYLKMMKSRYGVEGIAVLDGLANGEGFAERLSIFESLSLKVFFVNGLRADMLLPDHIQTLSRITPSLTVSAECASSRVRNNILKKRLALKSVDQVAADCLKNNLPLKIHYMVGVPGEIPAEINDTLDHACKMVEKYKVEPLVQLCSLIPGTPLYDDDLLAAGALSQCEMFVEGFKGADNYPYMDFLRTAVDAFNLRLKNARTDKLIMNLTYRCDNNCEICAVGGRAMRNSPTKRCLRLLKEYRERGVEGVDFDGGEPTMHEDFVKIVRVARALGYSRVSVSTNGRSMSRRDYASRVLLCGITDILITLYGHTEEIHEMTTRSPNSFIETVAGIRNTLRLKPDRVQFAVNTVVTKHNYKYMENLIDFAASLGVSRMNFQYLTPFGRAKNDHCPPVEDACARLTDAIRVNKHRMMAHVVNLPPCLMPGQEEAVLADAGKFSRDMAFVDTPPMNLGKYLALKRIRNTDCHGCAYRIVCGGFYEFTEV